MSWWFLTPPFEQMPFSRYFGQKKIKLADNHLSSYIGSDIFQFGAKISPVKQ